MMLPDTSMRLPPPPTGKRPLLIALMNVAWILLALGAAYCYYEGMWTDVKLSPKLAGRVQQVYLIDSLMLDYRPGGFLGTRSLLRRPVFAFRLYGSPQTLGVYRRSGNYADLQDSIMFDDSVAVYYKPSTRGGIDLDVFQIEKGSSIILNYGRFKHNSLVLSYKIGGIAVIVFLIGQFFRWRDKRQLA